ncbi:MAG: 5-formyltetrahydrofolate cyclo-ligase [Proteobacteria bacterium]|nr:5-formyltetrahydrofolate cyclo-ligase [Pseudomonadota bacterium]
MSSVEQSEKDILRVAALARRDALSVQERASAALAIAARTPPLEITPSTIVAGYAPIRSEIDPVQLMQKLAARGAQLALPAISSRNASLVFRLWTPGDQLVRGLFGILEPSASALEVIPDIVLVPLAAFDRAGHRVGYGGGYYDRTFARVRQSKPVIAIGVAFAVQEIPQVPALSHDVRLDYVLTEIDLFDFRS